MSFKEFPIARAAALLQAEGMLVCVYLPENGGTVPGKADPAELAELPGTFLGAGLDNRQLENGELFVALHGEKVDGRKFAAGALADGHWVLTRAVDGDDTLASNDSSAGVLVVEDPETALGLLAAHWRQGFAGPLVGITGTNGKTTTKDFVAAILSAEGKTLSTLGNFNSKLGLPVTLLRLREDHAFAVVEMGASAVGHIAYLAGLARPDFALITNAGQAHLEEFGSLEDVIEGKGEILDNLPASGRAILNTDSPGFQRWMQRASSPVVSFGQSEGDYLWSFSAGSKNQPNLLEMADRTWQAPLPGQHNAANLAAAVTLARTMGLDDETIARGLEQFQPSAHRSKLINLGGRLVLDDTYNANPASMVAAAESTAALGASGQVILVLGHMAELGQDSASLHHQTGADLANTGASLLLAVGAEAEGLAQGFRSAGKEAIKAESKTEASVILLARATPGDAILIKGSRSARMEELVETLKQNWPTEVDES